MAKFKVGDRVVNISKSKFSGWTGKVIGVSDMVLVEYDKSAPEMHSGGGKGKEDHCWWSMEDELELVKTHEFKIGDKVVANSKAKGYFYNITSPGWCGIVESVDGEDPFMTVNGVGSDGWLHSYTVRKDAFDFVSSLNPKRRVIIEITDEGAEAKYIVGKRVEKTAVIKRHRDDKPDDYRAAVYAAAKVFDRKVDINDGDYFSLTEQEAKDLADSLANAQGYLNDAKEIVKRNAAGK